MQRYTKTEFEARCAARKLKHSSVNVIPRLLKRLKRCKLKPKGTFRDLEYKHKKKRF